METNRLTLVRKRASKLLKKYRLSVPVDLAEIISRKGIVLLYKENQVGIDGLCQIQKDPPIIEINTEIGFEPRRRFTLAHEIGHICIPWHTGIDLCSLDNPYFKIDGQRLVNTQELEANIFASELLMPTEWLKNEIVSHSYNLKELIEKVQRKAGTSIMACLYALENALPAGNVYFVKSQLMEYWKPFTTLNTFTTRISLYDEQVFFLLDKLCLRKNRFDMSVYQIIHYELLACPNDTVIDKIYHECNSNFEDFLNAISNFEPIKTIHFMDKLLEKIYDKYYILLRIGN